MIMNCLFTMYEKNYVKNRPTSANLSLSFIEKEISYLFQKLT